MTKIDLKHRVKLQGKYNILISKCPYCDIELLGNKQLGSVHENIIGFADSNIGNLAVIECPSCFEYWVFHSRINEQRNTYHRFLNCIEKGTQKHFKKN